MARGVLLDLEDNAVQELKELTRMLRVADRAVLKTVYARAYDEVEVPLVGKIKAAANGPHGRLAAGTVKATRGARLGIWLGRGSGLGATVAMGAEWGGRKNKKVRHVMRSKGGRRRYIVQRRTTMQFRPHLGRTGYWMAPTMRREGPKTVRKVIDIAMDELLKLPGAVESRG